MSTASTRFNALLIRKIVAAMSTVCVAGMIVTAALRHVGGVITFGCLSSAGIVTLMAVIATAQPSGREPWSASVDRERAELVEALAAKAEAEGASDPTVRSLIGAAVELGRSTVPTER